MPVPHTRFAATPRRTARPPGHRGGHRWLASILAVGLVLAACGGDNNDTVGGGPGAGELTLVSSGASWRGQSEAQTTFDVSAMKTDPTNLGVVVRWEFATHESNPSVAADLTASYAVDGFSPDRNSASIGGAQRELGDRGGLTLVETDGGFVVEWKLGFLLGASDLTDPAEFEEFVAETGANLEDANYSVEFADDADGDGVLIYDIALAGEIDIDGQTVTIREPVRFDGIESDPTAEWVERDEEARDAVERAEAIEEAEGNDCLVAAIEVDLPTVTLTTSDGVGTITVDAPEGWDAEIPDYGGPCPLNSVSFDVPDDDGRLRPGPSVNIWEPYADALLDHIAEDPVQQNFTFDDEGNEVPLEPGDEFYLSYAEPEPIDVGGPEAYLVRSTLDLGDGTSEDVRLFVDLGAEIAFISQGVGLFGTEEDFLAFVDRLTFEVR